MSTRRTGESVSACTVLRGARVVTPAGVLDPGWVQVVGGRIAEVGVGPLPAGDVHDLGGWLLPGFIDIHMHGGGGHDVTSSPQDMTAAVAFHHARGTTATLVSLVTAPLQRLCEQLSWAADLAERGATEAGCVLGAHLEGPFLSPARCGAQNPDYLSRPDRGALATLIDAARGHLRIVTVAPELPGALDLIEDIVTAGIVAAVGHTDATYAQATAAFERGATLATHLFNAMRPIHHREPGPVLAALDGSAHCEIINDGVHVHPAVLRAVLARGTDRLVLVTDAISAAGMSDGRYQLSGQEVIVAAGHARLRASGNLAGSTLTMDGAVRRGVLDGLPIQPVAAAAASNPAHVLGEHDRRGSICAGRAADLILLDDEYRLVSVMTNGRWLRSS